MPKRIFKQIMVLLVIGVFLIGITACVNTTPAETKQAESPSAAASQQTSAQAPAQTSAAAVKEVVIGAILPLSVSSGPNGTDGKNGIDLAVEIIYGNYPDLNLLLA